VIETRRAAAGGDTMLRVERVSKVFGGRDTETVVLDGIDLSIDRGELVCLLGASGCGKTTLLNILAGFEPISGGSVTLGGRPLRPGGRDGVMLFQDAGSALFPWLTVEENVRFGLNLKGLKGAERNAVGSRYLRIVGLEEHRSKFPAQLSGGMQQRLQIARALAVEPGMLLMDEPFAALDAITRRHMQAELLRIWESTRTTIVFVTHDIAEAITLADRIAIMTVGPRSRIAQTVDVRLPRPRSPADPAVGALFDRIETLLVAASGRAGTDGS
jgi:NitT/TauT family transport system ATP-binding protein